MNRRHFISKSAALFVSGCIASRQAYASPLLAAQLNKGRIGIQLFSVRAKLSEDFVGTLQKLSDIGYSSIEPYGFREDAFFNYSMKELSDIVKDMDMVISGVHTRSAILPADTNAKEWDFWKKCADSIKSGGGKWAIHAGYPGAESVDDLKRIAEHFNRVGEVCEKAGVKFAYHNNYVEFNKIDGEVILDYIIRNTDPKLVSFQLDMGHVVYGGGDCMRYLRDFRGRFALWHASDVDAESKEHREVGKGSVPFAQMFEIAEASGLEQLIVEQETGSDILASCKVDFDYLKQYKWTQA